jgi:hypothetical protein
MLHGLGVRNYVLSLLLLSRWMSIVSHSHNFNITIYFVNCVLCYSSYYPTVTLSIHEVYKTNTKSAFYCPSVLMINHKVLNGFQLDLAQVTYTKCYKANLILGHMGQI